MTLQIEAPLEPSHDTVTERTFTIISKTNKGQIDAHVTAPIGAFCKVKINISAD